MASRFHNRSVTSGSKPHIAALESLLDMQSQSQPRPPDVDAALRPGPCAVGAQYSVRGETGPAPRVRICRGAPGESCPSPLFRTSVSLALAVSYV